MTDYSKLINSPNAFETKKKTKTDKWHGEAKWQENKALSDLKLSKDWDKSKSKDTTTTTGEKGKAVGKILGAAASAVQQFTQSRKVDYSSINKSSRGNVGESDLTAPGYSDYFARDNNGPV